MPVRKPARGELEIDVKTPNALLRSLRYQGERGFALTKQRWRALQHVPAVRRSRISPTRLPCPPATILDSAGMTAKNR